MKLLKITLFSIFIVLCSCKNEDDVINIVSIEKPINFIATKGTYIDQIVLNWASLTPPESFHVYRYDSIAADYTKIGETTTYTYIDSTVTIPNADYSYKVMAYNSEKEYSEFSDEKIGSIDKFSYPTEIRVNSLKFIERAIESIELSFPSVKGADEYEVYRSDNSINNFKKTATIHNDYIASSYYYFFKDLNVKPSIKYYYKVRARNYRIGFSNFSNIFGGDIWEILPSEEFNLLKDLYYCRWNTSKNISIDELKEKLHGKWKWDRASIFTTAWDTQYENVIIEFDKDKNTITMTKNNEIILNSGWEMILSSSDTFILDLISYDFGDRDLPYFGGEFSICDNKLVSAYSETNYGYTKIE